MLKKLLIFFYVHAILCNYIFPYEKQDFHVQYLTNLLKIYKKFDKIFHIDEQSKHEIIDFVSESSNFLNQIIIYNHDRYEKQMKRPDGGQILNVVFLKNLTKLDKYLRKSTNFNGKDVVIFVTNAIKFGAILHMDHGIENRPGAGNILIFNRFLNKIELYHLCQYCGRFDNKLDILQTTNGSEVKVARKHLLPNNFRNFFGHEFTILFNQYYPFMYCENYIATTYANKTYNKCLSWIGSEAFLLDTLSEKMDFSYKLLALTEYITVPKMMPYLYNNEKIDFAIGGIEISAARIKKLLFTRLTNFEDIVLMYKIHVEWKDKLFAFLNAFNGTLWLWLGFASLVHSSAIFLFVKILHGPHCFLTYAESLQIPMRITIEQPILSKKLIKNIKFPIFVLLSTWMVSSIEFNTLYKSNLASRIIHPPIEKYKNIFELIKKDYKIGIEDHKLPYLNYIFKLNEIDVKQLKTKFFNLTVLCRGVNMVLEKKIAIAGEHSFLSCHCQKIRKDYYYYGRDVNFALEPLSTVGHGWLFRNGIPYVEAINKNILRIQTVGLMDKWTKDVLWKNKKIFKENSNEAKKVKLNEFVCHFTLYFIGITASFVALIGEYLYAKISRRL